MKKISNIALTLALLFSAQLASANHTWSTYHWARTANPFTIKLGDNVSAVWKPILNTASTDWTASSVLDTTIVPGLSNVRTCKPTTGRVEVCNNKYGNNGWLGLASIWASGEHITQGTVKLNDTYFGTPTYNTTAWRNLVSCQEIGHTFGLDHQDTNFNNPNLGTCMDYTNDPTTNQFPNQGDYDQLLCIYDPAKFGQTLTSGPHSCTGTGHLDAVTTVGQKLGSSNADIDHNDVSTWGKAIRFSSDKKSVLFEKDLANDQKVFTFVVWAQ